MNAQREFFESLATGWDALQPPERGEKLRGVLAPFAPLLREARRVLEIGTGTGALLPIAREYAPHARFVSLDLAQAMLARAAARAPFAAFAQADAQGLPVRAASFDLVVCHGSFPHFVDKPGALAEIKRVLKPGASVLIAHEIGREQINAIHRQAAATVIHDHLLPSGEETRALLTAAGFVDPRVDDAPEHYCAQARVPARGEHALVAENISTRYGDVFALRDVSLTVQRGEMIGLFGANGAGKSTFLKAALGLVPLAAGTLTVLGNVVGGARYHHARPRIGYVPQKLPGGRFPVTVRDAVAMGRYGLAGMGRALTARDHALVVSALEQMRIGDLASRLAQNLSGGQAQRVAIARALAQEPELLLLDEPTASLDRAGQVELARQVQQLNRERGITVVIVSHNVEVARLCQRLYLFDAGQACAIDSIAELGYA
ncbi:MAG: ATP-binding cassette domain-containing protein [Chloroflexi bacterium]|nr:ATP-binding cassette domain-containing protein [Chloroflexota bacterium]